MRGTDDVIAYHVRQSFRPGEISPEEANRLGVEFAKRFTKGNHALSWLLSSISLLCFTAYGFTWTTLILALKQLTETTDNIYRYGLLQKLGAKRKQINRTLFTQTAVFFAIPLTVAGIYSAFLIGKAMTVVEEFMNIHISTNIGLTIILFLIVYGSYFLATYLSCKRIVTEQKKLEV